MSPLPLAAGQHHFAIKDFVAPNARDGQPVTFAANIADLAIVSEGNRPKSLFTRFFLNGSDIKCQRNATVRRNKAVTPSTSVSAFQLPVSRNQRPNVTAALGPTG